VRAGVGAGAVPTLTASGTTSPMAGLEAFSSVFGSSLEASAALASSVVGSSAAGASVFASSTAAGVLTFSFLADPLRALLLLRIRPMIPPEDFLGSGSFFASVASVPSLVSVGATVGSAGAGVASVVSSTGLASSGAAVVGAAASASGSSLAGISGFFPLPNLIWLKSKNDDRRRSCFSGTGAAFSSSALASPLVTGASVAASSVFGASAAAGSTAAASAAAAGASSLAVASVAGSASSCFFSWVGLPRDLILSKKYFEVRRRFFSNSGLGSSAAAAEGSSVLASSVAGAAGASVISAAAKID
jgi:hypothetical protein